MELNQLYFYTATILNWQQLLKSDKYKLMIIDSLRYLIEKKKIVLYAYVKMPNHIHMIWELLDFNGKEMPHASFMKYTGHIFKQDLESTSPNTLSKYRVNLSTRNHQFWKREALPVLLYSYKFVYQKLNYIHNNPLQERWQLAEKSEDYRFSSARFYENREDEFGILSHIGDRI